MVLTYFARNWFSNETKFKLLVSFICWTFYVGRKYFKREFEDEKRFFSVDVIGFLLTVFVFI